jgi:hypothetical protein
MVMSTHLIHQPGVAALERWGLLDELRASGCPPIASYRVDFGSIVLTGCPPAADGVVEAYAPRRKVLRIGGISGLVDGTVSYRTSQTRRHPPHHPLLRPHHPLLVPPALEQAAAARRASDRDSTPETVRVLW